MVAVVAGTRPEAIKLAPVIRLLGPEALVVHTGQHYSRGMSGHVAADVTMQAGRLPDETRGDQLGRLDVALDRALRQHQPDTVLVQGDTTSALAGALAANATGIPPAHLEAGLRSFDRAMPEEHILNAVSCGSPTSCEAVDSSGYTFSYSKGTWSAGSHLPGSQWASISCGVATSFVAVGGGSYAVLTGTSWSAPKNIDSASINAVSCTAPTFCEAVTPEEISSRAG